MPPTADRNPLAGEIPSLLARYGPRTRIGKTVRKADAKALLTRMKDAETEVKRQEQLNARISDRLQRMQADHELHIQYLIEFGAGVAERYQFQQILQEVSGHGGLSLRHAADLACARYESENGSSSEDSRSSSAGSDSSGADGDSGR